MRKLGLLTAAAALAAVMGMSGSAWAQFVYTFDGDLVAYWSFDDLSDPTSDDSGKGHDGTLGTAIGTDAQDPTYVTADADKAPIPGNVAALDFDAGTAGTASDDQFVDIADADALDLGTVARPEFTIAAWVNPDTTSNQDELTVINPVIVGKDGSGNNERSYELTAGNGGDGKATIFVLQSDDGVAFNVTFVQGPVLPLSTWTHVAATYKFVTDGTSELKIYVDGVLGASTDFAVGPVPAGTADLNIGRREFSTSHAPFDGLIDDVRIYDVALSANQIAVLANPVLEVAIDIKPGSDPNSINLCGVGVIPVAIFGSADIPVSDIDIPTLRLGDGTPGGSEVKMAGKSGKELCSTEDVDFDGFDDLVCKFVTVDLGLVGGDTDATVLGTTTGGKEFVGTDSVNIVKDDCG